MILVDTSVWIDHLREGNDELSRYLAAGSIVVHPFVIGEISLGTLRDRKRIIDDLQSLPRAAVASHEEVLRMIESVPLFGIGLGYVDAHLLAATRLTGNSRFWTRDKRLKTIAQQLLIAHEAS